MGKKRKAGGRSQAEPKASESTGDSTIRVTTFEDVADSEDEFHMNQDKILLDEGPAAKKMRKWKEQDEFLAPSDEEVLDYSTGGEDEDLDEDEDADEDDDNAEDDADSEGGTGARKRKGAAEDDEDEDVGGWGPSKKDYYNADAIETEQDALDEEKEARRIQQKQLQAMTEADFGFDEEEWLGTKDGDKDEEGNVVTEVLPQLHITESMTEEEKLKIMRTRYPEFEHITKEYLKLQPLHDELASAANAAERLIQSRAGKAGKANRASVPTPMAITKYRTCAAYLAAMAMYFAILGSTADEDGLPAIAMDPTELHDHPVMESLLKCQRLWHKVESLPVADPMVETTNNDELSVIEEASSALETEATTAGPKKKEKRSNKTKDQLAAEAAQAEAAARRAERLRKTEQELANLSSLTDKSALRRAAKAKQKKSSKPLINLLNADDSDFGEETDLTAHELAEKARKKKTLRFYTSQIAQKANKRDAAGKDQGGDADIPHRERLKDRQARLQALAEKRGQHKDKGPGEILGAGDDATDSDNDAQPRGSGSAAGDDGDYYDLVAARSKAKKAQKEERAAAYALAAKEGGNVVPEEVIGADGKRKISYLIQKNKGLTPHRKKDVRNPRVKKKLKYEAKKKKLKSQKAVYAGGEGRGGYGGELTGIKKGLVKSTKL
ncbi:Sas10 C-terminal domain-domain-containing protein [Clohesyomyces aquaticus]|uniref:Sas10 C-terminal domain-domain-containing protein n=1 Tax=Clohesyomyces aquaticus TaxID=1231657 RepID=A0A1Y1ZFR5_9PLEO|nr:Sas10 C-terminal domain-domain-containing protein [Clohesyomyces aquaticus]